MLTINAANEIPECFDFCLDTRLCKDKIVLNAHIINKAWFPSKNDAQQIQNMVVSNTAASCLR